MRVKGSAVDLSARAYGEISRALGTGYVVATSKPATTDELLLTTVFVRRGLWVGSNVELWERRKSPGVVHVEIRPGSRLRTWAMVVAFLLTSWLFGRWAEPLLLALGLTGIDAGIVYIRLKIFYAIPLLAFGIPSYLVCRFLAHQMESRIRENASVRARIEGALEALAGSTSTVPSLPA